MTTHTPPRHVAVLGAGFAGLAAATTLADAGLDVTVLEARGRVGGRVWSQHLDVAGRDCVVERGAEFILDGYSTFAAIAEQHSLRLVDSGMSYYVRELAETPEVTPEVLSHAGQRAAALARELERPVSVEEILQLLDLPMVVEQALRARIEVSAATAADLVTAEALDHVASFEPLPSYRVAGGNQRLAVEMHRALGERVHCYEVVRSVENIDDARGAAVVRTSSGEHLFDHVVVALPLTVLTGGHVHVPTSDARDEALARLRQGHAAKLHLPLRSIPSTSAVLSVPGRFWTWTAVDEHGTVAPVMNSFAGSEHGLAAMAVDAGPEQWMGAARHIRNDLDFAEQEPLLSTWSDDPFALGAYASHAPGTTIEDQTALEAAVGAVSFAGEYAEAEFTGLMEGALRSGIRAAQAVLAAARGESDRTGARTDKVRQAGTR